MKRLLLVAWLTSAAISTGAQTITPRVDFGVFYFDSAGRFIGWLAGNTLASPEILFMYNGTDSFSLGLVGSGSANTLTWNRVDTMFFTGAGCSGRGLVNPAPFATTRRAALAPGSDNTLYVSEANAVPQLFTILSQRTGPTCTNVGAFTSTILAVDPVVNLDSLYTLPFHMYP